MSNFHDYVLENGKSWRESYENAKPYKNVVIDGMLKFPQQAATVFPLPDSLKWFQYDNFFEKKLACPKWDLMPPTIQSILKEMNQSKFLSFLEDVTGILGLIPDPYLNGGGMHLIESGGYLHMHSDFSHHPKTDLTRVLNVILFLNDEWKEEYGGNLELWDREMKNCPVSIAPILNRMAVFFTPESNHGHPDPLNTPKGKNRQSLAVYYYQHQPYSGELPMRHSTIFKRRPTDPEDTPEIAELRFKRGHKRLEDKSR